MFKFLTAKTIDQVTKKCTLDCQVLCIEGMKRQMPHLYALAVILIYQCVIYTLIDAMQIFSSSENDDKNY